MQSGSIFSLGSSPCSTHRCGTCTSSGICHILFPSDNLIVIHNPRGHQVQEAWHQAAQVQYQEKRVEVNLSLEKPVHCIVW